MSHRMAVPLGTLIGALAVAACSDAGRRVTGPSEAGAALELAAARSDAASGGAAVFIDVAGVCGLFDGSGNVVAPLNAHLGVFTPSRNGNAVANCFAQVDNPTGRALRYDADHNPLGVRIPCVILDGQGRAVVTYEVHEQISASGQAHLICVANSRKSG